QPEVERQRRSDADAILEKRAKRVLRDVRRAIAKNERERVGRSRRERGEAGKIQRAGIKEPGIVGKTPVLASELQSMSARRDADVIGREHGRIGASLRQIRRTAQIKGAGDIENRQRRRSMAARIEPILGRL